MKFKITYFVRGIAFEAIANSAFYALSCVSAIIKAERLMFPNPEKDIDSWLEIIADIATGKTLMCENHIFRVERLNDREV